MKNAGNDAARYAADKAAGPCGKFPGCACGRCEAHRGYQPCRECGAWDRHSVLTGRMTMPDGEVITYPEPCFVCSTTDTPDVTG